MTDAFAAAAGQGHAWIAARIPHAGSMCLLAGVVQATPQAITCTADSHRAPDHPLRQDGRLGAACGVEYAAQAMALHGTLRAAQQQAAPARIGLLVNLRELRLHTPRLDGIAAPLTIHAECETESGNLCIYRFHLHADGRALVEGRLTVILGVTSTAITRNDAVAKNN